MSWSLCDAARLASARRLSLICGLALLLSGFGPPAQAEDPPAEPGSLIRKGLGLAAGETKPGLNRRVKMLNQGQVYTALVHCEVGRSYVVMLPDGKLTTIDSRYANATSEPFYPAKRTWMAKDLLRKLGNGFQVAETKQRLYCYNCSEAFQKRAAAILDAVHDGVYKHFQDLGFTVHEPRVPLAVIIFRTEKEFQEFSDMGENVNGYYDILTNYIVFYEESELNIIGTTMAADEVLSTVAHEGVHQTLANIGVQSRLSIWPAWVTEGLAEFYSPTTEETPIRWKGLGEVNDLRMANLDTMIKRGDRAAGSLIRQTLLATRLDSNGYAASWGLAHYLNHIKPATFLEYVRNLSLREPLAEPVPSSGKGSRGEAELELFYHFFGKDLVQLERGMNSHLRKLPFKHPLANATHYVAILEYRTGTTIHRSASLSITEDAAVRWRDSVWEKLTGDQRATGTTYIKTLASRADAQSYASRWLRF